jgi:hypothetical protein
MIAEMDDNPQGEELRYARVNKSSPLGMRRKLELGGGIRKSVKEGKLYLVVAGSIMEHRI